MIGRTISHYRITEESGRIGRGVVYIGHDRAPQRTVARTFPFPHRVIDPGEPLECPQRGGNVRRARVRTNLSLS